MTTASELDQPEVVTEGIHPAMIAVSKAIGPIAKQRVQSFNAFNVDDIYAHIGPLLTKYDIHVVPRVTDWQRADGLDKEGRRVIDAYLTIEYRFIHADGSFVVMTFTGEGRDYQDKAANKAAQQAFKYGLIQMFQITTGEVDPDAINPQAAASETAEPDPALVAINARIKNLQKELLRSVDGDKKMARVVWDKVSGAAGIAEDAWPTDEQLDRVSEYIGLELAAMAPMVEDEPSE